MAQPSGPSSVSSDRPERSRNAKAQARHRAKRKAYIEQLEQTVTKLQTALALSPDQVAALPPPTLRIRQLEQENAKLIRENDDMRRQLHIQSRRPSLMTSDAHFDVSRRGSYQSADSHYDRDLKRRRMSVDEVYLSPSETPSPPTTEALARTHPFSPPPLPQPSYLSSASTTSSYSSASMLYSLPPPASPPAYSQPQAAPQHHHYGYEAVKVEEDTYLSPTQESSQQHLSYPALHSFHAPPELGSWHTYSADRTQIQH